MWLSDKKQKTRPEEETAQLGKVTVQNNETAVFLSGERRDVKAALPGGYHWRPRQGDAVLVIKAGEEATPCLLGKQGTAQKKLNPGEVWISLNGENGIWLKQDGTVHLEGEVYINGQRLSAASETEVGG